LQANVPQLDVQRANLASIAVGHVGIGPIHIGELVVQNANVTLSAGAGILRNVRVTITLQITLSWRVHIGLPWPFDDIDIGDDYDLGSPSFSTTVGDITIPGLSNIQINVPSLRATNATTGAANPLTNLQIGQTTAEQIRARNAVLPTAGFTIAGLTLESVDATAITAPAAQVGDATVGRVRGDPLRVGEFSLGGLNLPAVSVPNVTSTAPFDIPATLAARTFRMDAGVLVVSLRIRPSALSHVEQLRLTNANASASVGQIVLRNIVLPYEALNLTLGQIGIETIGIPAITVA
jgi:hypothetical protein